MLLDKYTSPFAEAIVIRVPNHMGGLTDVELIGISNTMVSSCGELLFHISHLLEVSDMHAHRITPPERLPLVLQDARA
jgi:hypothetical protein